ncbi:hypothetical protein CEXT_125731 [Caerostris extrusa]|uniref:Uncharacterized protein n=1 Tax=Caerostris extrusa TaxID=172846 RepID=A0AAV4MB93_CAEEX|nr:hypothetical protein CEXT_125731 [Caerostris extrusa]
MSSNLPSQRPSRSLFNTNFLFLLIQSNLRMQAFQFRAGSWKKTTDFFSSQLSMAVLYVLSALNHHNVFIPIRLQGLVIGHNIIKDETVLRLLTYHPRRVREKISTRQIASEFFKYLLDTAQSGHLLELLGKQSVKAHKGYCLLEPSDESTRFQLDKKSGQRKRIFFLKSSNP